MGSAFWTVSLSGLDMQLLFVLALSVLLVHAEPEDIEVVEEEGEDIPFQRSAAAIGSTDYEKEGMKEVKKPHFLPPYPGFPYPGHGPYPGQHPHGPPHHGGEYPPHHGGEYPPHHGPEYRPRQHDEDYNEVNHGDYKDDDYTPKHAAPVPSTPHHGPAYPGFPYPLPPYHHCPNVCDIDRYSKCTCVSPAVYNKKGRGNCNVGASTLDLRVWCYVEKKDAKHCPDAKPSKSKPEYFWSRIACITK